jgi:hypothetical protein
LVTTEQPRLANSVAYSGRQLVKALGARWSIGVSKQAPAGVRHGAQHVVTVLDGDLV